MSGEWRQAGVVHIVKPDAAVAAADAKFDAALEEAHGGDCEGAQETFKNARRHIARNDRWYLNHVDRLESAAVACLIARADKESDPMVKARVLAQARVLDHRDATLVATAEPLAQTLVAQGDAARAAGNWEPAYRAYAAALSVDPTLTWVRRHAEEMRDLRLGIYEDEDDALPGSKPPAKTPPKKPAKPTKPTKPKQPAKPAEAAEGTTVLPDAPGAEDATPEGPDNEDQPGGE
jgi:hypothetical protein